MLKGDIVLITFQKWLEHFKRKTTRQNLNKTVKLAEKYGLGKMTMEEISEEVKVVRQLK